MAIPCNLLRHLPPMTNSVEIIKATNTRKATIVAYTNNLRYLSNWLTDNNHSDELPLPASVVHSYAFDLAEQGKAYNTIRQRLSAISWLHELAGFEPTDNPVLSPELHQIGKKVRNIRTLNGLNNNPRQKKPLRTGDIRKLCRRCDASTACGLRNKVMLLIGFTGALRRGELVSLKVGDIEISADKKTALIKIRTSKTDHYGIGQSVTIHASRSPKYCPISCLLTWLSESGITAGFLFPAIINNHIYQRPISGEALAGIIKSLCKAAGLDAKDYAGHSLRRGLLTSAVEAGKGLNDLRVHARHCNYSMTEQYIGQSAHKESNPSKGLL